MVKQNKVNNNKQAKQLSNTNEKGEKENKSSKLQKLIKKNEHFQFISNGKVRCKITSHQFLPTLDNFQAYIKSKSYKKGVEAEFDISEYEEYLVPHKLNKHFLFCRLTGAKLPIKKTALMKHVQSKRFQRRLEQIQQNQDEEPEAEKGLLEEQEEAVEKVEQVEHKSKRGKKSKK